MRKYYQFVFILLMISGLLASCSQDAKKYRIGVSQCSDDIWRDKQNSELQIGAYFHDNVELRFAAAYDSDERQIQQIDSLVGTGIDLLIVAPNQVSTISPAIDRAYDKGIPVIVFERKTNTKKYTAYMGADNYEMGHLMGEYVATRLNERGIIIEVMGLKGSSPAIERHNGFREAIAQHPGIQVVATLQGDWTEPTAYNTVKQWLDKNKGEKIDLVFGMNDRTAMGARKAFEEAGGSLPLFCGIDGLPGENGGIRLVQDSLLDASYIYPTHGDQLLQLAVDILEGKPYEKETNLMSALVTQDNARVLLMESEEIMRQSRNLEQLHEKASQYFDQLGNQRTLTFVALAAILLLLALLAGIYMYYLQRARIQDERMLMEREQLDFYTQVSHELRTPLTLIQGPLDQLLRTNDFRTASDNARELFSIVRRNTQHLTGLINKMLDAQVGTPIQEMTSAQVDAITVSQPIAAPAVVPEQDEDAPTVLIVDDNADIRTYLRSILQGQYRLLEAEDGKQGLELAREQVPDLIVSDVMMPVMNGLEFCQQVKKDDISSHIPIILLTARALEKHQIEGYESGADAYITKPFSPELLLARIDNLLQSRHQLKDLWSMKPVTEASATPSQDSAVTTTPIEDAFISRFKNMVEERLSDNDLSIEDLAADMGLSRVQLYRKVKALTGSTPVDLLRKARLAQAHRLLQESTLTVSEIAYQVGFASPSYFTKCYKDEFGTVPGEARKS
ncbi:MAG: substrate-binding domain-containing protein [Muribaculaceae bacterium]|nr:substrate-binding domain-containing protein [Muribaculaceae bacterium]